MPAGIPAGAPVGMVVGVALGMESCSRTVLKLYCFLSDTVSETSLELGVRAVVQVLEHKPYGFKADVFSFGITMW